MIVSGEEGDILFIRYDGGKLPNKSHFTLYLKAVDSNGNESQEFEIKNTEFMKYRNNADNELSKFVKKNFRFATDENINGRTAQYTIKMDSQGSKYHYVKYYEYQISGDDN